MKIKINLMVLIVFILNIFTSAILTLVSGGGVSEYFQIYITQIIPVFLPSLIYFLYYKNENSFDAVKRNGKITIINILLVILLTVLINICTNVLNQIIFAPIANLFFKDNMYNITKSFVPGSGFDIIFNILFICLIPALFEEILFRGIVLSGYEDLYGTKKSIIMCGLIFAFMHRNISAFIPQFVIGVYLSFVVIKFNSIFYGMIAHFVHNILNLILHIIWEYNYSNLLFMTKHWLLTFLISLILMYVLIAIANITIKQNLKTIKPLNDEIIKKSEKKYFNAIIIIYIIMQILSIILQFI